MEVSLPTIGVLPVDMQDTSGTVSAFASEFKTPEPSVTLYDLTESSIVYTLTNWNQTTEHTLSSVKYFRTTPSLLAQVFSIALLNILCFLGNLLLILTIYKCIELRNIGNMLIINLALIGILLSLAVLPTWSATTWRPVDDDQGALCQVPAMLMFLLFLEAILTLGGIAVDRYGNICHPFKYPIFINNLKAIAFIAITWGVSVIMSTLPFMGFGRYAFGISELSICTVDFGYNMYFSVIVLTIVVVPACLTICICYWKVFIVARKQAQRVKSMETSVTQNSASNNGIPKPRKSSEPVDETSVKGQPLKPAPRPKHKLWQIAARTVRNSVRQSRAFRTVFTIIGCFLTCWTPYIVLIFYAISSKSKPGHTLEFVVTYLALSNYVANPLICVVMNKEFRKGVKKLFGLHRKRLLENVIAAWTEAALTLTRSNSRIRSRPGSRVGSFLGTKGGPKEGSCQGSKGALQGSKNTLNDGKKELRISVISSIPLSDGKTCYTNDALVPERNM